MSVTYVTHPSQTALTTLRRVKVELGLDLSTNSHDELLTALVADASDAIGSYCGRAFPRAELTETLPGTGRLRLILPRTPLKAITSIVYADSTLGSTSYSIEDEDAGFVYREDGFYWTPLEDASQLVPHYTPSLETQEYAVTYVGGYLLPEDTVTAATLSILTSTESINDSASGFPLLVPGDRITTAGWTNAANNGTHTVVSRTAAKIVVSTTSLVAEASTDQPRTVVCRDLPRDLERACVETVKAWYLGAQHDPTVSSKRVGDLELSYSVTALGRDLPANVMKLLSAYRRHR
ncbi:MAG: phage head-tail connector protein [Gallionellaceae bacterium]|nr:phage head-tail connector protein [Gallionellaceae bacterium]